MKGSNLDKLLKDLVHYFQLNESYVRIEEEGGVLF